MCLCRVRAFVRAGHREIEIEGGGVLSCLGARVFECAVVCATNGDARIVFRVELEWTREDGPLKKKEGMKEGRTRLPWLGCLPCKVSK